MHLWKYRNYSDFSETFQRLKGDATYQQFNGKLAKLIKQRENQICLSFTFWGEPEARTQSPHIYEMRSYSLKPGTLIEWGNNWSRGIRNRMDYRVAGMFTQVNHVSASRQHKMNRLFSLVFYVFVVKRKYVMV